MYPEIPKTDYIDKRVPSCADLKEVNIAWRDQSAEIASLDVTQIA